MIHLTHISKDPDQPQKIHPYSNRQLVLWGEGELFQDISRLLGEFSLIPEEICHHNPQYWGTSLEKKLILSPELLLSLFPEKSSVVIQLALPPDQEKEALLWIQEQQYPWVILTQEAKEVLGFLSQDRDSWLDKLPLVQQKNQLTESIKAEQYLLCEENTPLFLCLPPKTGDHSLIDTFQRENISHHFLFHDPSAFPMDLLDRPTKLITAVRDPIAQNISFLYQVLGDLSHSITAVDLCARRQKDFFVKKEGDSPDVQQLFPHLCQAIQENACYGAPPIQHFLPSFQKHIFDLCQGEFHQDEGYGIVKQGDLSVFVFQIEKLNQLLPQLSQFLQKDILSLEMGNLTQDKWLASSYQQALASLHFPQSYVEDCYKAPWVSHFYSPKDIQAMKQRWASHVCEPSRF